MMNAENSSVVKNYTMTKTFVDRPPSTYSMKIQSLSQLKKLFPESEYKSTTFSSGNYNWRLVIYPTGNKKNNGNGFVSMYVELDTTSIAASSVLAYFNFFIFNKRENKIFGILGNEGKQFNALRPSWGLPQVLPLDTFNDPKNGYVFNGDQCEFGVDVMVPLANWEVVSFSGKYSNPKFSWTVKNFSKLNKHCYESDMFLMGGRNWVLELYPNGDATIYSNYISIFVYLADTETVNACEQLKTLGDVQVLDPFGHNHRTESFLDSAYTKSSRNWGWHQFMSLSEIPNYLDKEGSLNIEIEFEVVTTTTSSPSSTNTISN